MMQVILVARNNESENDTIHNMKSQEIAPFLERICKNHTAREYAG